MPTKNSSGRKRFIHNIKDDVWGLLRIEARREGRSDGKQLEKILEQRYRPESLTEQEIEEAIKIANENVKTAKRRPRKGSKKASNGGED
jgi:plasmid stability protein